MKRHGEPLDNELIMKFFTNKSKYNYKSILGFSFVILTSFGIYKYYEFKKYVTVYNNQSEILAEKIESYSIYRMENIPSNELDFNQMLKWLKGDKNIESILKYGINFKYDSLDQSLSIYSFGVDKKDDDLKKTLNTTTNNGYSIFGGNYTMKNRWFYDFLKTSGKDVELFNIFIDEDFLCLNFLNNGSYLNNELSNPIGMAYSFFQGNKKVNRKLEIQLKDTIRPLIYPKIIGDSVKISFVRFKNGRFYSVCSDDTKLDVFDNRLKEIFSINKIDYAIIPMLSNEPE